VEEDQEGDGGKTMGKPLIVRKNGAKSIRLGPDEWNLFATGADTDGRFDFLEGTISYLQGPPLHIHHDQDDTIMVMQGTLKVQVGEELFDLTAGDFVSIPRGVAHTFANLGEEPVRVINVMTPGGFGLALEEMAGLPPGPPAPEVLSEITAKHGVEFVGPPIPMRLGMM
jgi:mannose-6-phosphate isomerase-like protein (cupin superfamily)